jgi:hypothetical protein
MGNKLCSSKEYDYSQKGPNKYGYDSDTDDDIDYCSEVDFYVP